MDNTQRLRCAGVGDETRGHTIINQYADKDFSFAHAVSFAIMDRLHIRRAWTYDEHFAQDGSTRIG